MDSTTLNEVQKLAALNYTPKEIALLLDLVLVDVLGWMEDECSPFYKYYWKGWYETDIKVRNSIFKMAASGSSPAQALALKIQEQNERKRAYE